MDASPAASSPIDAYIAGCAPDHQPRLRQLADAIRAAAPAAGEKISYAMPTFYLAGNLVHFALFAHHVGFYPAPSGIEAFAAELAAYPTSKGAIRLPLDQPLPLDLIDRIVRFRVVENLARGQEKARKSR
jgi:uncharacterized protein YdhG (YjbR/CyaY superfamily)